MESKSYFDGGLLEWLLINLAGAILTGVTFGLAYLWATSWVYGFRINHTIVEGKRLKFTGTGASLFAHWILWWFLTVITFGIYGFWVVIEIEKWKAKNTTFA